jgi:hypothetical protein
MSRPISRRPPLTRRELVKTLGAAAALGVGLPAHRSVAAELTRLDVNDPAAAALGYIENATHVDAIKYPSYVRGSSCEDCLLLEGGNGASYRPCHLFPGKLVAASGWCTGWTAEI